ncbi:MAG: ABC transporter ATP-binding protein [Bacteroidales bacterium]|jgi:ABC-2 type transport system ATP-binding protein|nr:ABC transporter ATP-binding protein [Bacteroidales bacterium]
MQEQEKENSIAVENLCRNFRDFIAVDDISFQVKKGEIFGFLGANGAGKTTTIRMLCGLLKPTSGYAEIMGYNVLTQGKEIRKHIGYMSQKFSLYEDLTVIENMELFGTIYGMNNKILRRRILNIISRLRMRNFAHRKVVHLPLGQRQKLAFSTAILHAPQVVFLDEPTSGVDPLVRREFWNMIYEVASGDVTILVTTHYMDEAEYCNRLCIMSNGKIKIIGNPAQLKKDTHSDTMDMVFQKVVNNKI